MIVEDVAAASYRVFEYEPVTNRHGLIRIDFSASAEVNVYVMSRDGVADFAADRGYAFFGGARRTTGLRGDLGVPRHEPIFVVVCNRADKPAKIKLGMWT